MGVSSSITALVSGLKDRVISLPNKKSIAPNKASNFTSPSLFLQNNTLLKIQIINQILRLTEELLSNKEEEENRESRQVALKILILQLKIELIRIKLRM